MGRPLHPALKRKNSRKILGGKGKESNSQHVFLHSFPIPGFSDVLKPSILSCLFSNSYCFLTEQRPNRLKVPQICCIMTHTGILINDSKSPPNPQVQECAAGQSLLLPGTQIAALTVQDLGLEVSHRLGPGLLCHHRSQ